jgi:hypothetical protein
MMAVSFFANVCDIRSLGGLVIGRTVPAVMINRSFVVT